MLLSVFLLSILTSVGGVTVPVSSDIHSVGSYIQLDLHARDLRKVAVTTHLISREVIQ